MTEGEFGASDEGSCRGEGGRKGRRKENGLVSSEVLLFLSKTEIGLIFTDMD